METQVSSATTFLDDLVMWLKAGHEDVCRSMIRHERSEVREDALILAVRQLVQAEGEGCR